MSWYNLFSSDKRPAKIHLHTFPKVAKMTRHLQLPPWRLRVSSDCIKSPGCLAFEYGCNLSANLAFYTVASLNAILSQIPDNYWFFNSFFRLGGGGGWVVVGVARLSLTRFTFNPAMDRESHASIVWDKSLTFSNFNGAIGEVCEWISNFIPLCSGCNHLFMSWLMLKHVSKWGPMINKKNTGNSSGRAFTTS